MKVKRLSLLLFFLLFLLIPRTAYAWDDCPFGKTNDPAPGSCPRFIDTDNDGICDHSQPAPEDRAAADTEENEQSTVSAEQTLPTTQPHKSTNTGLGDNYYALPITILTLLFYALTALLVKKEKMKLIIQRRICNVVLTISFLVAAVTSILYLFYIASPTLTFIHVDSGLVFILFGLFHALWHLPYYKKLFK